MVNFCYQAPLVTTPNIKYNKCNIKQFPYISLPQAKNKKWDMPNKANPIFCSFNKPIVDYIHKVGGICIFLRSSNIDVYDFQFCSNKEVWIFHLTDEPSILEIRFGYALLRQGTSKVRIQCFPLEGEHHG